MPAQPEPWKSLRAALEKMQERLRRLENRSPFFGTGMRANGSGGIDSDNFVAGTSGYSFKADGNAEFNDLTLRGGIIGNDALTNPVSPTAIWETDSAFTVSPSWSTIINRNVTVPPGFTTASISAKGRVTAFMNQDSTGDVDYLFAVLFIAGNSSDSYPLAVTDNGGSGTNHVFRDVVLTGLTGGGSVNLQLQTRTSFETWTSPSFNEARLGASIQWSR